MTTVNYNILRNLDEKFGSPFYIMNPEQYKKNINDFLNAFRKKYEKVIAGYSFKSNYVPA
jgi:diaminopimelate decarboxylase